MLDIVLYNGRVLDGCGNPWYRADIGIKDGRIVQIGNLKETNAAEKYDMKNNIVAPGFIDIHTHSDALPFAAERDKQKILQGVTTEVNGNCGISAAPVNDRYLEDNRLYTKPFFGTNPLSWQWRSMGEYLKEVEAAGVIGNFATLVGHGTVRIAVMGFSDRAASPDECKQMQQLVEQALTEGAYGLSSGLIYPPGQFSAPDELVELCKVVAAHDGLYATHIRNESAAQLAALTEAIDVAGRSGVRLEISHHKVGGKANWGMGRKTVPMMEKAREAGVDVTFDVYPYTSGNTTLVALLPPWATEGGVKKILARLSEPKTRAQIKQDVRTGLPNWENLALLAGGCENVIISTCRDTKLEGKYIGAIARDWGLEPEDAMLKILADNEADATMIIFVMNEEEVASFIKHPLSAIGSDGIPVGGRPHPRFSGTFVRVIEKYVMQDKLLTLPEAVRKMTSLPAQRVGLAERGLLKPGMWADIVAFDPSRVKDQATYDNPLGNPEGISYVFVNGSISVKAGKYTGAINGKVMRK